MKKKKTYNISARIVATLCTPITADSLDDAVAQSKSFSLNDFVNVLGEEWDSELRITGAFEV